MAKEQAAQGAEAPTKKKKEFKKRGQERIVHQPAKILRHVGDRFSDGRVRAHVADPRQRLPNGGRVDGRAVTLAGRKPGGHPGELCGLGVAPAHGGDRRERG